MISAAPKAYQPERWAVDAERHRSGDHARQPVSNDELSESFNRMFTLGICQKLCMLIMEATQAGFELEAQSGGERKQDVGCLSHR